LIVRHWGTLTALHLRHLEFHPSRGSQSAVQDVYEVFAHLRKLERLSLTGVEGFVGEDWLSLFIHPISPDEKKLWIRSPNGTHDYDGIGWPAFPHLKHLELDFVSDAVISRIAYVYGHQLVSLKLFEYARLFDHEIRERLPGPEIACPKKFAKMIQSFEVLEELTLGVKSNSINLRLRRIIGWFLNGDLQSLNCRINFVKL